jgi:hypothetical protein
MIDFCCDPLWNGTEPLKMRMTYWYILESFLEIGRIATLEEIERDLFLSKDHIQSVLKALSKKGVLRLDSISSRILDAYPYSSILTRHRICLDNGMEIYCMCAIDTFYVPFLTECDITIHSHCFFCRSNIEIAIEEKEISRATPANSMIWNSTAQYTCPMTNFFCSEEHLLKWRTEMPNEKGQIFSLSDSLGRGKEAVQGMKQSREGLNRILWAKAEDIVCFCREVPKAAIVAAINSGILSLKGIAMETTACTGNWCEDTNPMKRCCSVEIKALIKAYSEY